MAGRRREEINVQTTAILWPMITQVALTALVWIRMYQRRLLEMYSRRIDPQTVATRDKAENILQDVAAADNFRNLFEVPVLFFAVCLCLAVADLVSATQVFLAWLFVGLRALHSLIHVTYNRVVHRFMVHVTSCLCVFTMWLLFAADLAGKQ